MSLGILRIRTQEQEMTLSKLADKIRKAARGESQPLGFGATTSKATATMVLAGIAKNAADAPELARRGADAVIVASPKPGEGKQGDVLSGAHISGDDDSKAYRDGGFDFVVFDPDKTSSTAVLEEEIGYVMALPKDVSDVELRAIESFRLDAVDVGPVERSLTVRRQIDLRRIFALAHKPLMARVPADIDVRALQALRDTNVLVVAVEGADNVERLRKTIDALPPRSKRREDGDRPAPFVPTATSAGDVDDDDE